MSQFKNGRRVAIVYGLRTPFAKSGTLFKNLTTLNLGKMAAAELINRTEIEPGEIDKVIFGNVFSSVNTPNLAREIALGSGIPSTVPAFTVTSACASASQAFTSAVDSIASGDSDAVVTGGVESTPEIPPLFHKTERSKVFDSKRGGGLIKKAVPLLKMGTEDIAPAVPYLFERYTGLTMGEAAEKTARRYKISRGEQDEFALRSHKLASRAQEEGIFEDEIVHTFVPPEYTEAVTADNGVRDDLTFESLSGEEPLFDREFGTVTTGNSAYLSDGASVLLLLSEEKARSLGYKPLAYVRSYAYAAVDPSEELLMGPAYSTPLALDRAGISLRDIDLIEIHEAFASQVLSNIKALSSRKFAKERLGRTQPVGEVDMDKLNVSGGSIAIGHPLAATGGRVITTLVYRMAKRRGNFGLVSLPASGGLGVSIVLEKE